MSQEPIALNGLYLEDSYFLGLVVSGATLRLRGLFALTKGHKAYTPPILGEQHCYREGEIALTGAQVTAWTAGRPSLLTDPDGSMDLGSISFGEHEGGYQISAEWFDMRCRAESVVVTLD